MKNTILVVIALGLIAAFFWRLWRATHPAQPSAQRNNPFVPPQRMPPARRPELPKNKAHIERSRRRKARRYAKT